MVFGPFPTCSNIVKRKKKERKEKKKPRWLDFLTTFHMRVDLALARACCTAAVRARPCCDGLVKPEHWLTVADSPLTCGT